MAKKFLVITSGRSADTEWTDRERYVKDFYESLGDYLPGTSVAYTTYHDISCTIEESGRVQIFDNRHGIDLKEVDLVHFKNWMFDNEEAAMIAFYLTKHGVAYVNTEVNAGLAWGKTSQMCRLAMNGLPVPNSFFAHKAHLKKVLASNDLPLGLKFPLIMKSDAGAKGADNYLVKNAKEAIQILNGAEEDKEFVLQEFHPNDGDYRFLFIGLEEEPLVFIRRAHGSSHLNNTSQGGTGKFVNVSELPKKYLDHARKAAKILNREVSGVDILVDKQTQKPYVLEVNSTPALATGYGVDKKAKKFADFLKQMLEVQEEE